MSNGINKQEGNNCADIFARLPVPSANINKAAAPDKVFDLHNNGALSPESCKFAPLYFIDQTYLMEFDEQQAGVTPEFKPCIKFDKRNGAKTRKRLL